MVVVKRSIEIAAPQNVVFDFVADHRNVQEFIDRVTRFGPMNGKAKGLGSRFAWELSALGFSVGAEFEVVEFEPHDWMAAESISGPRSMSWWRFKRVNGLTLATFGAGYELPRMPLVAVVGGHVIEREVGSMLENSLSRLKATIEGLRSESDAKGVVALGQQVVA